VVLLVRRGPAGTTLVSDNARATPGVPDSSHHLARQTGEVDPVDVRLERAILTLLERRAPTSTICPSDAARAVDPEDWRGLMPAARQAAAALASRGEVVVTQRGEVVDVTTARGPVRIARKRSQD